MAKMPPKEPLVVVIGATGTGKSKLAVSLATKYNGEIINADALQMYRGLPIVTNKMPENERNGIPHHLLDRIGLDESPWTVHEFVADSLRIIDEIRGRGKMPIVVGGTTYYVFSLLFKDSVLGSHDSENENIGLIREESTKDSGEGESIDLSILEAPTSEIYAKLQEVDPAMARSWHPNDRRKIQRSLEIWLKTGKKASELYEEQKATTEGSEEEEGRAIRQDPLIFWLDAENTVLRKRLDNRVEAMVEQGLLEEVRSMRRFEVEARSTSKTLDKSKGVWVAIGYKEMAPWLNVVGEEDSAEFDQHKISKLQHQGIDAVKAGTKQYAKRQNRWARIRLSKVLQAAGAFDRLFLLDCTDLDSWEEVIVAPSENVVEKFLAGDELPKHETLSKLARETFEQISSEDKLHGREARFCESCNKTLMNEQQWINHLKSSGHKKVLESMRRRVQRAAFQAQAAEAV